MEKPPEIITFTGLLYTKRQRKAIAENFRKYKPFMIFIVYGS